jgi:predicted dehydrogenase
VLKVGLIGCGKIADQHAAQIQRVRGVKLVAACDNEPLMSTQFAERFDVDASYSSVERFLEDGRPDVVHITTPPQSHFPLAAQCLDFGCHVLVEKPFTLDYPEAATLLDIAKRKNRLVTVGHNDQFRPEMLGMRKLIDAGLLGGPAVHVESTFSYDLGDATYLKALFGDKGHWVRALRGKLLQNVISHGIAKLVEFIPTDDPLVIAHAHASPAVLSIGEPDVFDELRVSLWDRRNTSAYFTFTTQVAPPVQELRVFGPGGSLHVDNEHRIVTRRTKKEFEKRSYLNFVLPPWNMGWQYLRTAGANVRRFMASDFHMDYGFHQLFSRFYRAIQDGDALPIPYREILLTSRIMDEIFDQISTHGTAYGRLPAHPHGVAGVLTKCPGPQEA